MAETPQQPWIHVGQCPVCDQGLCRIRVCSSDGKPHFFVLCDECEAMWLKTETAETPMYADRETPRCPICKSGLYAASHWASAAELSNTAWESVVQVDLPDDDGADSFVTKQDQRLEDENADLAGDESISQGAPNLAADDPAFGKDDPKPGC